MKKFSFMKLFFTFLFLLLPIFVSADTGNVSGFAWSSNIGWISFTSLNDHDPSTPGVQINSEEYGVTENADGTLTGYAWSSNIGWIKFGGLSGFPGVPGADGTYNQNAKLEAGGELRGWARACAGTQSTINQCDNMTSRTDGWDGWISLQGSGYGITKLGNEYRGYAWGSEVVGAVVFDVHIQFPALCGSPCGVTSGGTTLDFDVRSGGASGTSLAGSSSVPEGTVPTFVWTIVNAPTVSCDITKVLGSTAFTSITGEISSGNQSGNPLAAGPHTFRFTCTNGYTEDVSFTVDSPVTGMSLGGTQTARIQFPGPGSANSEVKTIPINRIGFSGNVNIAITGINPAPPSGTTFTYSLDGGAFSASPTGSFSNLSFTFQASVSKKITTPYTVTLTGSAVGVPDATVDIIVNPSGLDPRFEEI